MDASLRAYLEQPAPRPILTTGAHTDRHWLWAAPVGTSIVGGIIVVQTGLSLWGVIGWGLCIVVGFFLGHQIRAMRQSLLRRGTFTNGTVISVVTKLESEDTTFEVKLAVEEISERATHRTSPKGEPRIYGFALTDRWREATPAIGAELPILQSTTNRDAIVFLRDDLIDARAI